jgi:ABC-type Fe3+/spermidine/putrescine transport system ATPase subunit
VLYITHDQEEAMRVASRIAVLRNGSVAQAGTPVELYQQPASQFVAEFIGGANFLEAVVVQQSDGRAAVKTHAGELWALAPRGAVAGERQTLMVRPERLRLDAPRDDYNRLSGTLVDVTFLGDMWRATVAVAEDTLWRLNLPPEQADENLQLNRPVEVYWKISDTLLLAPDGESTAKE